MYCIQQEVSFASANRYNAMDSVGGWGEGAGGEGPGMAHRMSADEIRAQQQVIIAGRDGGRKGRGG